MSDQAEAGAPPGGAGQGPGQQPTPPDQDRPGDQSTTTTTGAETEAPTSRADGSGKVQEQIGGTGSRSNRARMQSEARQQFGTTFAPDGTFVAGNVYHVSARRAEMRPGELGATMVEELVATFVAPADFEALELDARARTVLILRAANGYGRTATAVRLLQPRCAKVLVLDRTDKLGDLADVMKANVGYLLVDPDPGAVGLDGHTLRMLSSKLTDLGSCLVVTVTTGVSLGDNEVLAHVLELDHRPSHRDVARRHLAAVLGDRHPHATDADLAGLVAELRDDEPLRHAAELARLVNAALKDGVIDLAMVRRERKKRETEDFEIWFDSLPNVESRCDAMALAVLNGLTHEYLVEASRALARRLDATSKDRFRVSRRDLLRQLRAEVMPRPQRGGYGNTQVETVRYVRADYPSRVILRAWSEFALQAEVVDWIRELVTHATERVRVWSATALGILAARSFDHLAQTVLTPWAGSKLPSLREAAAYALHVAADDPALRPNVRRLVRGWYLNDEDELYQATAARAYGFTLGRAEPDDSIAALHRLARVDDIRVAVSIGASLAELFVADDAKLAEPILATLIHWLEDPDREATAHLAFLTLAAGLVTEVAEPDQPTATWPALLQLAHERPNLRWGLAILWHHLLSVSTFFPADAEEVLRVWADLVDANPDGCARLAELAASMCENDLGVRNHLLHECDEWADPEQLAPAVHAAAAIRAALAWEGQ